jgi:hypothetical protein
MIPIASTETTFIIHLHLFQIQKIKLDIAVDYHFLSPGSSNTKATPLPTVKNFPLVLYTFHTYLQQIKLLTDNIDDIDGNYFYVYFESQKLNSTSPSIATFLK